MEVVHLIQVLGFVTLAIGVYAFTLGVSALPSEHRNSTAGLDNFTSAALMGYLAVAVRMLRLTDRAADLARRIAEHLGGD